MILGDPRTRQSLRRSKQVKVPGVHSVEDKDGQRKRLKAISDNWKTCRKIPNVLPLGEAASRS